MKKFVSIFFILMLLVSSLFTSVTSVSASGNYNQAVKLVNTAKNYAGALKWEISLEYRQTKYPKNPISYIDMKLYNLTKNAMLAAEKSVATLSGTQKAVLKGELDNNVGTYYKRAQAFIDAITAGEKLLKRANDYKAQYNLNPNSIETKNAYSALLAESRKLNIMLYRVYGKSTRDAILEKYNIEKFLAGYNPDSKELKAHFIDVGQGDSSLIITPNGKTILIDGGKDSAGEKVVSYLKQVGVSTIDLLVSTHPDADHIGGLEDVLNNFTVKKILDSGKTHTSLTYLDYLALIDAKNIPFEVAKEGSSISLDNAVQIKVLNSASGTEDNNESSVVLKITYGEIDFLYTGDAEVEQEAEMVAKYDVEAEVLKVGHHGSDTSTSQAFVNEVKPKVSILSYGKDNTYGHPVSTVVNRLKAIGSNLYSTAVSGDIKVTTNGKTYNVSATPWTGGTTPTVPPIQPTGTLDLVSVNLDTEVVTIKNTGSTDVNMTGWKLVSVEGNQTYNFPSNYVLKAGATVYITSGPNAQDKSPTHLKWTGSYIWNNSGDPAQLINNQGVKVDEIR
ncbi:MBL fold metallo-hydrolase [Fredinandcohnia humi]